MTLTIPAVVGLLEFLDEQGLLASDSELREGGGVRGDRSGRLVGPARV